MYIGDNENPNLRLMKIFDFFIFFYQQIKNISVSTRLENVHRSGIQPFERLASLRVHLTPLERHSTIAYNRSRDLHLTPCGSI